MYAMPYEKIEQHKVYFGSVCIHVGGKKSAART